MLARRACALVDSEPFTLAPGEQALTPCVWSKRVPAKEFGCAEHRSLRSKVTVLPGVCAGEQPQVVLCLENASTQEVTLEKGDPVAVAGPLP